MKKHILLSLLSLAAFIGIGQAQKSADRPRFQEGAYYVRLKDGAAVPKSSDGGRFVYTEKVAGFKALSQEFGIQPLMQSMRTLGNEVLERTFLMEFDNTAKSEELFEALLDLPEVEFVERVSACFIVGGRTPSVEEGTPSAEEGTSPAGSGDAGWKPARLGAQDASDPFYGENPYSWHLDLINAEGAWALQEASSDIVVAVVDNAVWGGHPDLQIPAERQYNVLSGTQGNAAPPSSVSQNTPCDNIGTCYAYNWSHGTHCAGAVGAVNNNGTGIKSIGGGVSVMGVSCPSTAPEGLSVQNGFGGVSWAAEHGAKVISLSWGSYGISETERAVIAGCIDQGIVIVAAAGNDGYKDNPFYPANLPGVISIAAVNSDKSMATWAEGTAGSNYGNWVTLASPGGYLMNNGNATRACIFSTTYSISQYYRLNGYSGANGEYYDGMYGTSMATPVAAGLCGLILSANPDLTPYELRELLTATSQPMTRTDWRAIQKGSGVIDAEAALLKLKNLKPAPRRLTAERTDKTRDIELTWEAPENASVKEYEIYLNGDKLATVNAQTLHYTDQAGVSGLYHYGVKAVYDDGSESLRTCTDIALPNLWVVETTVRPEGCGTVTGAGWYPEKTVIQLSAAPVKGCRFTRWMEDGNRLGTDSILSYEMVYSATSIEAVFSGTPEENIANENLQKTASLKVYPNPVSDNILHMEADGALYSVEIYNTAGRSVLRRDFKGDDKATLNVGSLDAGLYIIKAFGSRGASTAKFTKN